MLAALFLVCFRQDTPLHLASEAGHTEVVRFLLENGGNVNAQDQMNGETPLHLACEAGFSDIVQLLLDYGADASIENVYKKRALHYADATTQVHISRFYSFICTRQHVSVIPCLRSSSLTPVAMRTGSYTAPT